MKVTIAILSTLLTINAQPASLTLSGPSNARPGATVPIALTLANSPTDSIAGLQWTVTYPAGGYSATVTPGAIATSANKGTNCTSDNAFCLLVGLNATVIPNGAVANYSLKVPLLAAAGTVTVGVSGVVAASPTGNAVVINAGAAYSFSILAAQDIDGNGTVNAADFTAMVAQVIGSKSTPAIPCTSDPNGDGKCDLFDVLAVAIKVATP